MPYGVHMAEGLRRQIDAMQGFVRNALPIYIRLRNFPNVSNELWAKMGFQIAPTGTMTGTQDLLVRPVPMVKMLSTHNIGSSGGKLRFGARQFLISGSFVRQMAKLQGLDNEDLVWRGDAIVGLVENGPTVTPTLFSIENIAHEEIAGKTVVWTLTCNSNELK